MLIHASSVPVESNHWSAQFRFLLQGKKRARHCYLAQPRALLQVAPLAGEVFSPAGGTEFVFDMAFASDGTQATDLLREALTDRWHYEEREADEILRGAGKRISATDARDRIRPYIVQLRDKEIGTVARQQLRKDQAQVIAEVCRDCCRVLVQMLHGGPPLV